MSEFTATFSTTDTDGNAVTGTVAGKIAAGATPPTEPPPTEPPPSEAEWPGPDNTGCDDAAKTPATSNTLNTAGKTYEGLSFNNTVSIKANNVTVKNCKITIPPSAPWAVGIEGTLTGVKIEDNTIIGNGSAGGTAVYGFYVKGNSEVTIRRNDISKIGQCAINDGQVTIEDNWIHDLESGAGTHYEAIYYGGAAKRADFFLKMRHNTFDNQINQTAAVFLESYFGELKNVTVEDNLLKGGSYTVYVEGKYSTHAIKNVKVINNAMKKGQYGYINAYKGQASVWEVEIEGNTDWQTGAPCDVTSDPNAMAPTTSRVARERDK